MGVAEKRRQNQEAIEREIGEQGAPPQGSAADAATPAKARRPSGRRAAPPPCDCAASARRPARAFWSG